MRAHCCVQLPTELGADDILEVAKRKELVGMFPAGDRKHVHKRWMTQVVTGKVDWESCVNSKRK